MSEEKIVLSKDTAKRIHDYLVDTRDRGPDGRGWKSDQLISDLNELAKLLGLPLY